MMDFDTEQAEISLSVIIPCWNQWELILDAIASVESDLDLFYEIILVTPNTLSLDQQELLSYFQAQGHIVEKLDSDFKLNSALNVGIQQATGKYIFPLFPHHKVRATALLAGIEILQHDPEVGVVYSYLERLKENYINPKLLNLSIPQKLTDIASIFRRKVCKKYQEFDFNKIFIEKDWKIYHLCDPLVQSQNISRLYTEVEPKNSEVILQQTNTEFNALSLSVQEQPLVSICIPSYNGERFIAEAISSALSQTYSPIELILSDDGSIDQTVAIAQSFQANTSINFIVSSHANYGLAKNCNFGLTKAEGKYIKFLFQDDVLTPKCVKEMVNLAEQDAEIGLVFSARKMCFLDGHESNQNLHQIYQDFQDLHTAWSNLQTIQSGQSLLSDPNLFQHPINKIGEPSTVLIRRTVFETVGLFDPELNQLVDWDMWLRIMAQCKVGFVNQVLSFFRLHTQQKTCQNIQENISIDLSFYQKVYNHPCYDFMSSELRFRALCLYTINLNHFYLNTHHETRQTFRDPLRKLRQEVAEILLNLPSVKLESIYLSSLGIIHRILVRNKTLQKEPLTESEQIFLQNLSQDITHDYNHKIQYILVLILYQNSTPPPVKFELSQIPRNIQKEIRNWMSIEDGKSE